MKALVVALLLSAGLSGCLGQVRDFQAFEPDSFYNNPGVFPGRYAYPSGGSLVLTPGHYATGDPETFRLSSRIDGAAIPLTLWRPVTEPNVRVPIIVDAGPYYEQGNATIAIPGQTLPFLIKNFVPLGYAVAQVAVRGTGTAGGCMELFGPNEVADLDQAITWLAERPWSNGNAAMIGASYDGSTPWMVASTGNKHLKTIVPVSGLPSLWDLLVHEGTPEGRAGGIHNLYWGYGFGKDFPVWEVRNRTDPEFDPGWTANGRGHADSLRNLLCPDAWNGILRGRTAQTVGHDPVEDEFWRVRDFRDRVVEKYQGSVFLIHGLQDWNVDPHVVVPFNLRLREKGIEVKEWYGQWGHAFPDTVCQRTLPAWVWQPCRLDYAEVLKRWFERWLYENETVETGPAVQVQDNRGRWRNAEAFPPTAPTWAEFGPTSEGRLTGQGAGSVALRATGVRGQGLVRAEFISAPLERDLRISGMPEVVTRAVGEGSDGVVSAWLLDESPEGLVITLAFWDDENNEVRFPSHRNFPRIVGHGQTTLRHQAGGSYSPGTEVDVTITFEPLEVLVPAGHRLVLWLQQDPYPDHVGPATNAPVSLDLARTRLRLPSTDADPTQVFPVPGSHFPLREHFPRFHQEKPALPREDEPVIGGLPNLASLRMPSG